jgi:hypothetical protein
VWQEADATTPRGSSNRRLPRGQPGATFASALDRPGWCRAGRDEAYPRGGGRDRDKLIGHVIGAEQAYARKLGVKLKPPAIDDIAAIEELSAALDDRYTRREVIAIVVGAPSEGSPVVPNRWTTSYAARRIAWHVLEHAWEMHHRAGSQEAGRHAPTDG